MKPTKPKARVKFEDLDERQRLAFATPAGFARFYLGLDNLYPKQEQILNGFQPTGSWVSAVCCNEAGKTTKVIAPLILWHLAVFKLGTVISTSGSWLQVTSQLVPALKVFAVKFPRWTFNASSIAVEGSDRFVAFSTNDPGRAEGFHGSPDAPLLALVDEAKSVRDDIFKAIEDRCRPQRKGFLSSPGYSTGEFYRSHTVNASLYKTFKITVEDCPHISREEMRRIITKAGSGDYERGLQDPVVRSAFFAEFMQFVEGAILGFPEVEECLADPPQPRPGDRHAFLDFAAGGDENVFAVRHGNRVWIEEAWRERDTMSAAGRFLIIAQRLKKQIGLRADEIEGDADGLGRPVVDRLREAGLDILDFHANARPIDPTRFKNRSAEVWFEGSERIRERKIILPEDPELKNQLTNRKAKYDSSGLRSIESKEDMRRRGVGSPDRADAVLGAMAELPAQLSGNLASRRPTSPWETDPDVGPTYKAEEMSVPEEILRGFDAGG